MVYRGISPLARPPTAPSAQIAVWRRELLSGHMCSWPGMPCWPRELERRTAEVVALCLAIDEESDTPDVVIVGGVYALPCIIGARAAGVSLTIAASCDPDVVEIRTVDTLFLVPFSPARD